MKTRTVFCKLCSLLPVKGTRGQCVQCRGI